MKLKKLAFFHTFYQIIKSQIFKYISQECVFQWPIKVFLDRGARYSYAKWIWAECCFPMYMRSLWDSKNPPKMLLASWFFVCFFKRFRCLNAKNLGSVGQRAAKLLAVKVGGLKKKSAGRPWPQSASLLRFDSRSRSNHSESLMAGNLVTLQPFDL